MDAAGTITSYLIGLRDIAAFMAARGVAGGAAALTRAVLAGYWMQAGVMREATTTRRMLAGFDTAAGTLRPPVRALVAGRRFASRPAANPLTPYDEQEWQHLQQACRRIADTAFAGHRNAAAAAGRGHDPASAGWSEDNLRWLLVHRGPASATQVAAYLGVSATCVTRRGDVQAAFAELFPGAGVVIAYRSLLGSYCGVVPDGIADLGIGDIDWAGDATVLLGYVKHRTAAESVTLPRRAVRLLEQWLEHSALARAHAPAELAGSLRVHCSYRSNTRCDMVRRFRPPVVASGEQLAALAAALAAGLPAARRAKMYSLASSRHRRSDREPRHPMTFPGPDDLPNALITHALGLTAASAATELICAHRGWLADPGFVDGYITTGTRSSGQPYACIRWDEALTALDDHQISLSGSAGNILRIAASLADHSIPVHLARCLGNLDHANIRLVTNAITRANGSHT